MSRASRWSDDELIVLIAHYRRYGLVALDDSHLICQAFAASIGRTASAVDRQARNLDDLVRKREIQHGGKPLADLWKYYRARNMWGLYKDANAAIDRNGWAINKF